MLIPIIRLRAGACRQWLLLGIALLLGLARSGPALAADGEARLALVIANGEYATASDRLTGPARDAEIVAGALRKLGFKVTVESNLGRARLEAVVDAFSSRLKEAGPEAVGIVYYAGHGGAVRGGRGNVLVPVDVPRIAEADLAKLGYPVERMLNRLRWADQARAIALVLDACRSASGSETASIVAPQDPGRPFLVAHSTTQDRPASDSSVYADAFAANIGRPGMNLDAVFSAIRVEVNRRNAQQLPAHYSGLTTEVCLVSCAAAGAAPGKYVSNGVLLDTLRGEVRRVLADLERQDAARYCARGYATVLELDRSAQKAFNAGEIETAGETWEQVGRRAQLISSAVSATVMYEDGQRRAAASREAYAMRHAQTSYERMEREAQKRLTVVERHRLEPADAEELRRMRDQFERARKLAEGGAWYDGADLLVDAINQIQAVDERASGNRRHHKPVERPTRPSAERSASAPAGIDPERIARMNGGVCR